jgi:Flp pilus assembly protein TadD
MSRKAVDVAARAIRHVGWRWARNSALLAACLITLGPGQGVADADEALLRCIARHGQAALKACDEAAGSDLGPAERAAAHYNKGLELMSLGRYEDAARAFVEAARLTPGVPAVHTSLGAALAHLHRWHEAAQAHRQALRAVPNDPDAHYNLGVALGHLGDWTEAITEFRTAAQLNPGDAEARYNLAIAFNAVGRQEEAIAAYGEAVRIRPGYAAAWGNLGMTAFLLGRDGEAAAAFARAEAAQSGYFKTRDVQRGAWETARRRLKGAPYSSPADSGGARSSSAPPGAALSVVRDEHNEAQAPTPSRKRADLP